MLDLSSRAASSDPLPADYTWLLPRHPREGWLSHANMGGHTRFWLSIHRSFRGAAAQLDALNGGWREGAVETETFLRETAPRLQHFLQALEHHHHMEDHVFFPRFTAAEPRVAKGIDLLETDHEAIDRAIHETVTAANALLRAAHGRDADLRAPGEAFTTTADALTALMRRHLDDEEEIVMPLILDRGEAALGVE